MHGLELRSYTIKAFYFAKEDSVTKSLPPVVIAGLDSLNYLHDVLVEKDVVFADLLGLVLDRATPYPRAGGQHAKSNEAK